MLEHNLQSPVSLEKEIALLNEQIEQKREQLEQENKIVSDKELIKEVLVSTPTISAPASQSTPSDDSYLNDLDEVTEANIGDLLDKVFSTGLAKTLKLAKQLSPLELDAFHDTLTDRLYDELSKRGLIK